MAKDIFAKISGTGSYLPEKVLSNHDLTQMVDTSDEWITQRVGIKSRHIAGDKESTSMMAHKAAEAALKDAGLSPKDIGLIIVATGTADYLMPATATLIQHQLAVPSCPAFDVSAACSGFVYAVDIAKQYIENRTVKHALVIASERMSRTLNWQDRATCVLFGDGAGAVVLSQSDTPGIIASLLHTNGAGLDMLYLKNPLPDRLGETISKATSLKMEGNKVFKHAVSSLTRLVTDLLKQSGLKKQDIDWLVPHQANYRILELTAKKLNLPMSQVVLTLDQHGNTSAASIPLAIDYARRKNLITPGQTILSEAFGAGIVWGGFIAKF